MMRYIALLFFLFFGCKRLYPQEDVLWIVKDSKPVASIVVSEEADSVTYHAAKVLQKHILNATGAELLIQSSANNQSAIFLSNIKHHDFGIRKSLDLDPDGFVFNFDDRGLIILGGSEWGLEYGVYAFLEKFLDVKWLMPTELWTEIPKTSDVFLPKINFSESPVFLSRKLAPIDIEGSLQQDVWGRYNRLRHRIESSHNLYKLFPASIVKNQYPDIFPTYDGRKYIPDSDHEFRWQPNFSSPNSVSFASRRIINFFKENPERESFSLSINDYRRFDESEDSRIRRTDVQNFLGLEDVSNDYFKWANEVIEEVEKVHPNKTFGALAYNNTAEPPSFRLADNLIPFLTQERLKWVDSAEKRQGRNLTRRWSEVSKELGWYDYIYGFNYLLPRVWFQHMQEYLSWGAKQNVRYYVSEFYPNWGEGPKGWITAKLLWNPEQNVDSLLNEWYVAAVGEEAAPYLAEYYSIWEQFWTEEVKHSNWWGEGDTYLSFSDYSYLDLVTNDHMERADVALQQALSAASSDTQKDRVRSLIEMWELYKASVTLFKQNHLVRVKDKKLDFAALNQISSLAFNVFYNKIHQFENDELYGNTVNYLKRYKDQRLWTPVSATVESEQDAFSRLSQRRVDIGKNFILNPDFEHGKRSWKIWQGKEFTGNISIVGEGNKNLYAEGVNLASVYQDFPYQSGQFVGDIKVKTSSLPQNSSIQVSLQILDENKRVIPNDLTSRALALPLTENKQLEVQVQFYINAKDSSKAENLRFKIDIRGFEESEIRLDHIDLFKKF